MIRTVIAEYSLTPTKNNTGGKRSDWGHDNFVQLTRTCSSKVFFMKALMDTPFSTASSAILLWTSDGIRMFREPLNAFLGLIPGSAHPDR